MRKALTVMIATVALVGIAVPATAAQPVKSDLVAPIGGDCGGGVSYEGVLLGKEIFRDLGDELWFKYNWKGEATVNDGTVVRFNHSYTISLDFATGTLTITGRPFGAWVGGSVRFMDRGRLVIDLGTGEPISVAGHFRPNPEPHAFTCEVIAAAQG